MNKRELAKRVAEKCGQSQVVSTLVINTFISCILESLEAGEKITIQDFGTLSVKQQKKRERFNLATNKVETYLPYDYIKFTASKSVKIKQKEKIGFSGRKIGQEGITLSDKNKMRLSGKRSASFSISSVYLR